MAPQLYRNQDPYIVLYLLRTLTVDPTTAVMETDSGMICQIGRRGSMAWNGWALSFKPF